MKIGPVDSGDRPLKPEEDQGRRADQPPEAVPEPDRTDSVHISDAARELSAQSAAAPEEIDEATSVDRRDLYEDLREIPVREDKVEDARRKMESGYYESARVKQEAARRIADDFLG